tara:strand:+ start:43 stop:666 length:624 start_codon:yes stop_codon:yes gene_type:complete
MNKDTYEYLTNFADDRTILNMLSVNKKFRDEQFFKRVMDRKYPFLIQFKPERESMKDLFIRMTYYISKLEEESGIPYINSEYYNPKILYSHRPKDRYDYALLYASHVGDMNLIKLLISKGAKDFSNAMTDAADGGHIDIVKFFMTKGARSFTISMAKAAYSGHLDIVKLMLKNGARNLDLSIGYAATGDHQEILDFLKEYKSKNPRL